MIDFRYHLVSLISVFLALAIGIVLGAGPLKDPIGNSLTDSVQALRTEQRNLHARLDTDDTAIQHRDAFITAEMQTLVAGQLTGRSVAIVTLPKVDSDDVSALVDAITMAGGKVTGQVSIGSAWTDPDQASARDKLVSDLYIDLPEGTSPTSSDSSQPLAYLLAGALVSTGAVRSTGTTSLVLKRLRSAGMIGIKGDVATLAGAALVMAPANEEVDDNVKPTASAQDATVDASYVTLATALDTVGGGTVVTGPGSAALGTGVLAAIRKDGTAKSEVSTVDTGSTPAGVVTAVLALREQLAGGSGAYGFVGGGTKQLPALASAVPSTVAPTATASPTATKK